MDDNVVWQLIAVEEIKQLKARYFRYLDTQDWTAWRRLFASDARLDIGGAVRSPDELLDLTRDLLTGAVSVHRGFMPEIEIIGPDTATGVWAMEDYIVLPTEPGTPPRGMHGFGHYREAYQRIADEWRIAKLTLTRLRIEPLEGGFPAI